MRVVLITDSLGFASGIAQVSLQVGRRLVADGHEVILVYPEKSYDQPQLEEWSKITSFSIAVPRLTILRRSPLRSSRAWIRTVTLLRRLSADIVYVHQASHTLLGWAASVGSRSRLVLHLHAHPSGVPGIAPRVGIRLVDQTIAVSRSVLEGWQAYGIPKARTTIVHNGVDLQHFRPPTEHEGRAARVAIGLPANAKVIGFIGRFTPSKGIYTLAEAFKLLAPTHPDAWLIMLGYSVTSDNAKAELSAQLVDLNVIMLPARQDPIDVLLTFDIGVLPSSMEAFPLAVIEMMAVGAVVLGSDVGGIPEALGPVLREGLTPPGDAAALAQAIERALTETGESSVAARYRTQAECFDVLDCETGVVDVFTAQLCSSRRRR